MVKNLLANAGDVGLIPGSGRSPEKGNVNPLQYSCLGNPMDRGAWWAIIHGVAKEWDTTQQLNNNLLFLQCIITMSFIHINLFNPHKNTMHACVLMLQSCPALCNPMDLPYGPARLLCPWDSPGKNIGWVTMPFSKQSNEAVTCIYR